MQRIEFEGIVYCITADVERSIVSRCGEHLKTMNQVSREMKLPVKVVHRVFVDALKGEARAGFAEGFRAGFRNGRLSTMPPSAIRMPMREAA